MAQAKRNNQQESNKHEKPNKPAETGKQELKDQQPPEQATNADGEQGETPKMVEGEGQGPDPQFATREEVEALREQNEGILGVLEEINNYIHTTQRTEPEEPEASLGYAEFDDDNRIEIPTAANPDTPQFQEKADEMAFMNENVEIEIHQPSNASEQQVVPVSVNGKTAYLMRGRSYKVPRYVVEVLARAVPVSYNNREYQDDDGMLQVRYEASQGLRFPFHIVNDTKRGREWFRRITRMGGIQHVHI